MAANKVVLANGTTLIDLTSDTVAAGSLLSGATAHDASGAAITGTLIVNGYYVLSSAPSSSLGVDGDIAIVEG